MKRYAGVIKRSSGLIVVTKYYKKELKDAYNIDENKILYIADGVDIDKFNVKDEKSKVRKYLKLPQDKKLFYIQGQILSGKD